MPEWNDIDLMERDLQLERELTDLGPAMGAASRVRAEGPDPAFLTALRTRLTEPAPVAPDDAFERRLRDRLVGRRLRLPWRLGFAAGAAVAAALALLLVLHPFGPLPHRAPLAVGVPLPSRQDLTRDYPPLGVSGGGGGYLTPTASRILGPAGPAYPKRLRLAAGPFPPTPPGLPVYRLAPDPFGGSSLAAVAHRLGISGSPFCLSPVTAQRVPCGPRTWTTVARNLFPSRQPLHSIAVAASGEVIYHDLAYDQFSYHGPALAGGRAVTIARSWLAKLGWPASHAPVLAIAPVRVTGPVNAASPIGVTFGWNRTIHATTPAAIVWVAPSGRVVEAHLWPPIVRHRIVAVRDIGAAWTEVASGRAPVAVEGGVIVPVPGTGSATKIDVVQVLVTSAHGSAYLEPAYRFSGRVTLANGLGTRSWYALVPAIARR